MTEVPLWLMAGCISGVVMGLAGSGGAMVSLPIFTWGLGMEPRAATFYALVVVAVSAFSNWIRQRSRTEPLLAMTIAISAGLSGFFFAPLKEDTALWVIQATVLAVCSFGVYSVWSPQNKQESAIPPRMWIWGPLVLLTGTGVGFLNVFTGLGGGVIVVPALVSILRRRLDQAVSTSLLVIALSSIASLLHQLKLGPIVEHRASTTSLLALALGCVVSAEGVSRLLRHIRGDHALKLRRLTFTAVAVLCIAVALLGWEGTN